MRPRICLIGVALASFLFDHASAAVPARRAEESSPPAAPGLAPSPLARPAAELRAGAAARLAYGQLPLSFEANAGQTAPEVKFLSRGPAHTLFFTPTDLVLVAGSEPAETGRETSPSRRHAGPTHSTGEPGATPTPPLTMRMTLVGANPHARVEGVEPLPGTVNYFIGNDRSRWRTNVATYGKLRYTDVYPGVDLVYYGNQRQLEYDFVVAPGADPSAIQLAFDGADHLRLDAAGSLVLTAAGGHELTMRKPNVYQVVDGAERPIAAGYVVAPEGAPRVGFVVGSHDATMPLVIDPVLDYSTSFGGSGVDGGRGIGIDTQGNVYIAGPTTSPTTFPGSPYQVPSATTTSGFDSFVVKLDSSGSVKYSVYFGGSGDDFAQGIAVHPGGALLHVAGFTDSVDFPTTPNSVPSGAFSSGGPRHAYLVTLVEQNNTIGVSFATTLGGTAEDLAFGVAMDRSSPTIAYLVGTTYSDDLPTVNAFQKERGGSKGSPKSDAFVAKLDTNPALATEALLYSTYLGGASHDQGLAILAVVGGVYVAGQTCSDDYPTTSNAFQMTTNGACDAFVARVEGSPKSVLKYSTYFGGSDGDTAEGLAIGAQGLIVTGHTLSTDLLTKGAFQKTHGGSSDVFVAVLNPGAPLQDCAALNLPCTNWAELAYSTFLGGDGRDFGHAVAWHPSGIFVTGHTCSASADFPLKDPLTPIGAGCGAFLTKLNPSGSALAYSTYLPSAYDGKAIVVDFPGSAYVTGDPVPVGHVFAAKLSSPPCTVGDGPLAYTGDGRVIDTQNDCLTSETVPGGLILPNGKVAAPLGIAVSPDGTKVYGLEAFDGATLPNVLVYDRASQQVTKVPYGVAKGLGPRAARLTPDGTRLIVVTHEDDHADGNSSHVYAMETATNEMVAAEAAGEPGQNFDGVAISPDGTRAYVHHIEGNIVRVLSTKTVAFAPGDISVGAQPKSIVATPDGKWLYVANHNKGTVSVVDTDANSPDYNTEVQVIDAGAQSGVTTAPSGMAVTPENPADPNHYKVYVTGTAPGMSVIDTLSQSVVAELPVGGPGVMASGGAVAVTPDRKKAYVAGDNYVAVIDVATDKWIDTLVGVGGSAIAIGPQDRDGDGIADSIDGTFDQATNSFVPNDAFSEDFTDRHLGGTSSGRIITRDGLTVTVWDAFNPKGFYAQAVGGSGTAKIKACGTAADQSDGKTFDLTAQDLVQVLCGSLTLEVIHGPVEVAVAASLSASVPAGGAVRVTDSRVSNVGSTDVTLVDTSGQVVATLAPGSSVSIADETAPVTTAAQTPAANPSGWNTTDVTVTLNATDPAGGPTASVSGVKEIRYRVNGGQEVVVAGASATLMLSTEGTTTLTYFAVDNAGNQEAPKTLTVKIDKTPPRVSCSVSPSQLWPPNNKLVPVTASVAVGDAASGPNGFVLQSVTSSEGGPTSADIQGFVAGSPSTTGQLRAQRTGAGAGRVYTLTYRGFDRAGNAAGCSATVTVPHDQGK